MLYLIHKLCLTLGLGEMVSPAQAVSGGLLHKMYFIETTRGKYAIKALNLEIMQRPAAYQNYINSERIANKAASQHKPALPALQWDEQSIHQIENQYFQIFNWVDGHSLKSSEVQVKHSERIGAVLSAIHAADFTELQILDDEAGVPPMINWRAILKLGKESRSLWTDLLREVMDDLYEWNKLALSAFMMVGGTDRVISHRDLDPKNIMWHDDHPVVIDWEAAGYLNRAQDFVETLLYWSTDEHGKIDREKFTAFICGYQRNANPIEADWRRILYMNLIGKLEWLEYNLKRSLESSEDKERQLGTEQAILTINTIGRYISLIPVVTQWLDEEFNKFMD